MSEPRFLRVAEFQQTCADHHCVIGVRHTSDKLIELGALLGLKVA